MALFYWAVTASLAELASAIPSSAGGTESPYPPASLRASADIAYDSLQVGISHSRTTVGQTAGLLRWLVELLRLDLCCSGDVGHFGEPSG